MNCQECSLLLLDFHFETLEREKHAEIAEHLLQCQSCRATLDKLEITHLLLSKDRTTRDETRQILNKRYPGALKELPVLMRTRVYTAELMLYAVPGSLARAEQDAR